MRPVRVLREARRELLEAARWYKEEGGLELARELGAAYRAQLRRAEQLPLSGHAMAELPPDIDIDVRSFLLTRFPYKLIIAVFPNEIVVLAVAHQRRRPFYWAGRLAKADRARAGG